MAITVDYHANPFLIALRAGAADDGGTWDPPAKCQVIDAWLVMTLAGTGTHTAQLTDGETSPNAITAALDISAVADKAIASLANLDDGHWDLIPGTDVLTSVLANGAKADIFVLLVWTD